MTPLGRYVLETLLTLGLVAGVAVAVLYAVRRLGVGRPSGPLSLAGRLVLDARKAIYLVRVGETVYVIGASDSGLTKLGELPESALGAPPISEGVAPVVPSFHELLHKVGARRTLEPETPKPAQADEP